MTAFILFAVLAGLMLGLRYAAVVLVPMTAIGLLGVGVYSFTAGNSPASASLIALAGTFGLQFGYVIGAPIRGFVTRRSADRPNQSPGASRA